ncbi:SRPBCC family protein [Salibaculum sp.]|uniref:SRPBCC family protein n=1 Tax=Salibaculum sp. TaxID=2855480 RepID=UPI002B49D7E3|nr:SRPBCC family protein [Salibaculum sp.]HKL69989.1 SRPBCC family protein [Salibaculum sp.]
MELSAREDIEAPVEQVFREVTDFAVFERAIMRRGGDVGLLEGPVPPETGARWEVKFRLRGKNRRVLATLERLDPGQGLTIGFVSPNIKGHCTVDLVALSASRTRLNVVIVTRPVSIAAKVLAQSLRLGRGRIERRFRTTVATYAEDIEARHRERA